MDVKCNGKIFYFPVEGEFEGNLEFNDEQQIVFYGLDGDGQHFRRVVFEWNDQEFKKAWEEFQKRKGASNMHEDFKTGDDGPDWS